METSPLTLAHDHARAASVATQSADTTVAINEHALAAGEFARAATGTGSAEALRTLRLLEAHHHRLSELLRFPSEHPPAGSATEPEVQQVSEKPLSTSAAVAELRASKSDLGPRPSSPLRTPPTLPSPRRLPPRDLSSSIASNLASARGIRANYTRQPLSPSISTQQAPGSIEALPRKKPKVPSSIPEHPQPSWVPPTSAATTRVEPQAAGSLNPAAVNHPATAGDEGFSRFYSTFENLLSKLSAPLAFAGLPLVPEETTAPAPTEVPTSNRRRASIPERASSDPDVTKYISRAALRASVRDGQSANDSFYVVPTTGHTVSYAHILSFDEKQKRRLAASIHGENPDLFADPIEEDDFVDARETPMPPTPSVSRQSSSTKKLSARELENKVEELDMQNVSLKEVVNKLSERLHAFEMSAQQNGMALQESMRLMRDLSPARDPGAVAVDPAPGSSGGGSGGGGSSHEALNRRVLELEEHVALGSKEVERLARENEKLKTVVSRYRDRWEKLKEGAKTRREAGVGASAAAAGKETPSSGRKDDGTLVEGGGGGSPAL